MRNGGDQGKQMIRTFHLVVVASCKCVGPCYYIFPSSQEKLKNPDFDAEPHL